MATPDAPARARGGRQSLYELRACPARPIDGAESFLARARPGASERVDAGDAGRDSPILMFQRRSAAVFSPRNLSFCGSVPGTPPQIAKSSEELTIYGKVSPSGAHVATQPAMNALNNILI